VLWLPDRVGIIPYMLLSQLTSALPTILERTPGDPDITSVEHDSRQVKPGTLFVARRGGIDEYNH